MNILKFNNFQLQNITNNIHINKYAQNPISFKSSLIDDSFERTSALLDKTEQEKQRVKNKVDKQKDEYNLELEKINEAIEAYKQEKQIILTMTNNEEYAANTDTIVLNYLDAKKLEKLTSKKAIEAGTNTEKIKEIIINYDDNYEDSFNQKTPSEKDLIKIAKRIIKDNSQIDFTVNCKTLINEYCKNNSVELAPDTIKMYISCLLETIDGSYEDFTNTLSNNFDKIIKQKEEEKESTEAKINDLDTELNSYYVHLEENPDTAAIYEPLLPYWSKIQKLMDTGKFIKPNNTSYPNDAFWILEDFGLINFLEYTDLIYKEDEQNKETLAVLSGKEGKLKEANEIQSKYHISQKEINDLELPEIKFISKRELTPYRSNEYILYDLSDTASIKKLEAAAKKAEKRKERMSVKKSKYGYGDFLTLPQEKYIPAKELQRLGYGNIKTIRTLIQKGELSGSIQETQSSTGTSYRTTVNLYDSKTPEVLRKLREITPVLNLSELAKELKISQKKLIEMIVDDEVDIIDEYLFPDESHIKYIDTRTEKNKSFIEKKLFENELAEQLKKQETERQKKEAKERKIKNLDAFRREQSLKMSIVWHFCSQTRDLASSMAVKDGYLCKLLVKDSNPNEELTQKEEVKVNSYRKEMWLRAGTDELKEGYKKANKILKQYHKNGLDSIEDEEIRNIIEQYENN